MNMMSKEVQVLCESLSYSVNDKRVAAYAGMARAYAESGKNTSSDQMAITDMAYKLNELTVLDMGLMKSIILKFIAYREETLNRDIGAGDTFLDTLGIADMFGQGMIDNIDNNIGIYRTAYRACKSYMRAEGM